MLQTVNSRPRGPRAGDVDAWPLAAGSGTGSSRDAERFSPLTIVAYVVRYRWLIALAVVTGIAAGCLFTLMKSPIYRATATLEVLLPSVKVFQDMEILPEASDIRTFMTAREKLKSRALAERVVFDLGLSERSDFLFPPSRFSPGNILRRVFGVENQVDLAAIGYEDRAKAATNRVLANLTVEPVTSTSLLSLTFHDANPANARDIANQIARSFIDQRIDQASETSDLARNFIQEQVVEAKEKLQRSEQALVDYARQEGILATGDDSSLIMANVEAINAALAAAIQENLDYSRLNQQIESGFGPSLEQVMRSEPLQALQEKISELTSEYQVKRTLMKPDFPEMRQLKNRIDETRAQLDKGIGAITGSIQLKYKETIDKVADLRRQLDDLNAQQSAFQDKNIRYTILKREVDSNRLQYDTLIAKLNEVAVGGQLKNRSAAIVDLAVLPGSPSSPKLSINVLIATILALAGAATIIYLRELMSETFTDPEQVSSKLDLPLLGVVPRIAPRELDRNLLDQQSVLSEAYHSVRTSLQYLTAEGVPPVLLITSSMPSEGKSTSVVKLAEDFGLLNYKVLIVDADMRRPSCHAILGLDNKVGLSGILSSTIRREDMPSLIRKTRFANVSLISSGMLPPNPANLLAARRMERFLTSMRKYYDLVIIDAPPVTGLSDAIILSQIADATVFVVSAEQVTHRAAKAALYRLDATGANVVGAMLSRHNPKPFTFGDIYTDMYHKYYVKDQLPAQEIADEQPELSRMDVVRGHCRTLALRFDTGLRDLLLSIKRRAHRE